MMPSLPCRRPSGSDSTGRSFRVRLPAEAQHHPILKKIVLCRGRLIYKYLLFPISSPLNLELCIGKLDANCFSITPMARLVTSMPSQLRPNLLGNTTAVPLAAAERI